MKYGLLGESLSHSYSREIHGLIADYPYELCPMNRAELHNFLTQKNFDAVNVTIPYKQTVMPYLDEISDTARNIGAVNTIVRRGQRLCGYNTDFTGMTALINRLGVPVAGKKVLILGTGGTARTARAAAEYLGAGSVLTVSRRTAKDSISYAEAAQQHCDAQFIINTTPAGMYPQVEGQAIRLAPFTKLEALADAVYNPLRSDLVLEAQELGIPAEGGLYMLSAQAVAASGLFLGREPNPTDTDRIFRTVRSMKRSIVLIGMPSSGKTCVGRILAEKTGMELADTDALITGQIGMPIADYFALHGEDDFRRLESETVTRLSVTGGRILATGGGAVLRDGNVRALKRNGILVFLDRSPEKLIPTADRPLSSRREELMQLYRRRYGQYRTAADVRVSGDGTPEETAQAVLREINK